MQQVYHRGDVEAALSRVVARIAQLRENVKDRVLIARPGGLVVHTRLQVIFGLRFDDLIEQSIHEIIVTHAHAAEVLGPGGFDLCIERLLEKIASFNGRCTFARTGELICDIVGAGAKAPVGSDLVWVLREHMASSNPRTQSMLERALQLAGFAGRIIVERARSRPSVELVRGYTFDLVPGWPLSARFERPRAICIDGFIEAVSELHHLLEEAAESKEPLLLFVRGMSDDVKNTLKVNYDRGSLRVVPIIAKFDIEGINILNDVAAATGADLVSSNKGDLISSVRLAGAPFLDEAIVNFNKVVVMSTASRRAVEAHVAFLRKKRREEKVDDIAKLFDARIKSLSPNHVVVRLPDDKDYVVAAQAIDYALRAVRSLVDHGTVEVGGKRLLTATAIAAEVHATRCFDTLVALGAVIKSAT